MICKSYKRRFKICKSFFYLIGIVTKISSKIKTEHFPKIIIRVKNDSPTDFIYF
jgi:hypothetical protein